MLRLSEKIPCLDILLFVLLFLGFSGLMISEYFSLVLEGLAGKG